MTGTPTFWTARTPIQRACLVISALALIAVSQFLLLDYVNSDVLGAANNFVTPSWIIKEVTRRLVNNWKFANNVNRDLDEQFVQSGAKMGDTVKARLPQRYVVHKGAALVRQDANDRTVDIILTDQAQVGIDFSSAHQKTHVDNYRERYITPAVEALVNAVDYDGLSRMYKKVYQTVGTPAVVPGSTGTLPQAANQVYTNAVTKLAESAVPTPYKAMLSPDMHGYLVNANVALFQPTQDVAARWKKGQFGEGALGISEWFMDQNVATHTVGALGTTPLINGAGQSGTSLTGDGASASVTNYFLEGDVIQLAGVRSVNPQSYQSTGRLQDFVVTANVSSTAGGALTIPISPSINATANDPLRNVSALPADNAAITTFSHASSYAALNTPQGLLFHQDAFALVLADLPLPGGTEVAERISNKKLGISVRFIKDYDINSDSSPARLDLLYGWAAVRPELACRICS